MRPEDMFAGSKLETITNKASEKHWKDSKTVLWYLIQIPNLGLAYSVNGGVNVVG